MNLGPRNVRSRLTLWYVSALTLLLVAYVAGALFFLYLSMREQIDRNLLDDLETVEGLLVNEPNGFVSLQSLHPEEGQAPFQRFIEVWSPDGVLLYRSALLRGRTLGRPPAPDEGRNLLAVSYRLDDGTRVRLASSVYHIEDHRVVLRVAHSEERMWHELGEFSTILGFGLPVAILLAAAGGYALARKVLAPIDSMTEEIKSISATRLSDRLTVENPDDELGRLAAVQNEMLARLEAAFDQLRRFTADASHELRTPLTALRSVGEVSLQAQKSAAEYRDAIGSMLEEVDCLTKLVESLLTLSRADAGSVRLIRADISLLALVKEATALVEVLADEKGQHIEVAGDPQLTISADRLILRQAIVNLLDNAIKYSPKAGRILVRVARDSSSGVLLEVADQGVGIPQQHLRHVFDRFYRVDEARTRAWGGTGLGLSIARWAVEAHGGTIIAESKEGQGTTFRVALPRSSDSLIAAKTGGQS